jgi:hypothetical protein
MSPYDYIILRQTLLRFFQGKNVKVSIFIQDNMQSSSGVIYLPMNDTAPPAVKKPGSVSYFNSSGNIIKETQINLKLSSVYQENKNIERVNIFTTEQGGNIYLTERKGKEQDVLGKNVENFSEEKKLINKKDESKISQIKDEIINSSKSSISENKIQNSVSNKQVVNQTSSYLNDTHKRKENIESVKREFGHLADLLGTNPVKQDESQIFKLDLFNKTYNYKNNQNVDVNSDFNNNDNEDYIEIEREQGDNLQKIKGMFDDINLNKFDEDEDDLLDLMDMAANN